MTSNIDYLCAIGALGMAIPLQTASGQTDLENVIYVLHLVGALFAFSLGALSLYAWSRRRNVSLIFVSAAFFVFFLLILLDEVLPEGQSTELISGFLELAILSLFFLTVFVGLGRRNRRPEEEVQPGKLDSNPGDRTIVTIILNGCPGSAI